MNTSIYILCLVEKRIYKELISKLNSSLCVMVYGAEFGMEIKLSRCLNWLWLNRGNYFEPRAKYVPT